MPSELDTLLLPPHEFFKLCNAQPSEQQAAVDDSDAEEIEDATLESEPESEVDEDLSLEMDDGRNANKVNMHKYKHMRTTLPILFSLLTSILVFVQIDRRMKWIWNI